MVLFAKVVLSTLALLHFFCFYRKTFRTTLIGNTYTWVPAWFKLVRVGRVFYAYESTDGVNWFYVHSTRMDMPMEIYVGMIGSFREGKGGNYVVLDHISID